MTAKPGPLRLAAILAAMTVVVFAALFLPAGEARQPAQAGAGKGEAAFSRFDFAGGRAFPKRAEIRIEDVEIDPGADIAHVPVALDRPTPNTVIARVRTRNGSGPGKAYTGKHFAEVDRHVIFRPGDPLRQSVEVPLKGLRAGQRFALFFPADVSGARIGDRSGTILAQPGAPPTRAETGNLRESRSFDASGTPDYELDPRRVRWSAKGRRDAWATRLPHGRTQEGNGESGLYLDPDLHPSARPSLEVDGGLLILRSQSLDPPIEHRGRLWKHGAAVLSGERLRDTHLSYGRLEWVARMPDRPGAWPAFWLLPESGWPPEIDVYEGFGYSPDWDFGRDISANIHGGARNRRSFTRLMRIDAQEVYGLSGFDEGFHRYAVEITPETITWFVDGRETYQTLNPFPGTTWFPLMTLAVKHEGEYAGGSGEMAIRSFKMWRD